MTNWNYEQPGASANEGAWHVEPNDTGGIRVIASSDDRSAHDQLLLTRAGVAIKVVLPPLPDLTPLVAQFPAIAKLEPLILAQRRLGEAGSSATLPPVLIHTAIAKELWPVFGMPHDCPPAGAALPFGLFVVWHPDLDQYLPVH